MERYINILIIDEDPKIRLGLKEILGGGGNNVLLSSSINEGVQLLQKKEIGIIFLNLESAEDGKKSIQDLRSSSNLKNNYIILIAKHEDSNLRLIKGLREGAVDYITYPFNPNLIKSKLEVFKSLYYKDQRIGQLLSNIFPDQVLEELSNTGKYSPRRIEKGVVLFTDFVDFSLKAKSSKPLSLIMQLEKYFTRFDETMKKYNLEKIKTIGDAYMALAGVTENLPHPAVRACLAALEIKEFMRKERDIAIALKRDFWEIRIGLHMGPLVAGILGSSKYSFDVWGDTVNVAARAEAMTTNGSISITGEIYQEIEPYFHTEPRGEIDIQKRGGTVEMYFLKNLLPQFCMYENEVTPNAELRSVCGLPSMDFDTMRMNIINRLRSLLPENVIYHDVPHTLNVEKAVMRYGKLEGIADDEMTLLRTAALYHDAGFIRQYHSNEDFGMSMAKNSLPEFGYTENQIEIICKIIEATKLDIEPRTLLEEIMCDADHDYLGRPDYHIISKKLRQEMSEFGTDMSDEEWINYQLNFLENQHKYYTETAKNIRTYGKLSRISDLRGQLDKLKS